MKIILPVAGKGTRLRPHTYTKPKSLMTVAGKTVLSHILDNLIDIDDAEFIFVVDGNGDVIKDYVKKRYDLDAKFVVQSEQLGPAHAVWLARDLIDEDEDILVVFNDTICLIDHSNITDLYKGWDGIVYVSKTNTPERFGIIDTYEDKSVKGIVEKPKDFIGDLAVVGVYYFKNGKKFMDACDIMIKDGMTEPGEYYMNYPIHKMIDEGLKFRTKTVDKWLDCGKPETLLETNRELLSRNSEGNLIDINGCLIIPPVYISDSAIIKNSLIGPYVTIGKNVQISNCKIENSIIDGGANLEGINLGDSIIGQNAAVMGNARKLNIGDNSIVDLRK